MISVTILTKNSVKYLHEVLAALKPFAEVIIYDTGSTDHTLEIARQFSNVTIHEGTFEGFGKTHNAASAKATHDWILSIDSDEILSPELTQEIVNLQLNNKKCVYSLQRDNYYNGKWIKWCGWYPEKIVRLYNRTETQFTNDQVHERIISKDLKVITLNHPMKHYSYACTSDFLIKMQSYSKLFAEQNKNKKKSSVCKAVLHGSFAFIKSYFLKKGIMGGREGFIISVYNANTAFYKYLKLWEANLDE